MLKNIIRITIILFSLTNSIIFSQKIIDNHLNSWWSYAGDHTLVDDWSLHTLYSFRRNDFVKNWQQSLLRIGPNFKISDYLTVTAGFDWLVNLPHGKQPVAKRFNEYRIFERFTLKNEVAMIDLKHRYQLEQRFVSGHLVRNRVRYRLTASIPLGYDNPFSVVLFDEVFMKMGEGVVGQYLEQNWVYIGITCHFNKQASIKLGYMNQYLIKSDNMHIENNHTLSFGVSYNITIKKTN